jgi:hypothetical protein
MSRTVVYSLLVALCMAGAAHAGAVDRTLSLTPEATPEATAKALFAAAPAEEIAFQGGQTLSLRGLFASESIAANLAFVNLAKSENRCTLALATADGASLGPVMSLTLRALENRPFLNVFEHKVSRLTEARATISCDRDFSAYALLTDAGTGQVDLVTPEESDGASLELPAKVATCPVGAVCFDAPGIVHIPAPPPGMPVGRVSFPAPAGATKRLRLSIDVTVAAWYPKLPRGKHLIYWFVVSKNIDMPGLLYFLGPGRDEAFARHGMGLTHPQKIKIIKPFKAVVGHTYHVDNDYDMAGGKYTVTITDTTTGVVKVVLNSKPNVTSYTVKAGANFLVDMGFFPDREPTEVPSYKWKYANVHVEAYRK